ncbi:hypothetical protein SOPP22_10945 [Shewanella sp. OPT22]|nr:hypothetical protein SOPP22_10945 [Shewanella sp. OPT22]
MRLQELTSSIYNARIKGINKQLKPMDSKRMSKPNTLQLTINKQSVIVKTHPEDNELFCLNDLHKASGGAEKHRPNRFTRSLNCPNLASLKTIQGSEGGTYAGQKTVYKYAAWIDDKFYDVVFDASTSAANGHSLKASQIAARAATPSQLIDDIKSLEHKAKEHIATQTVKGLINMRGHEISNYMNLAIRAATGYLSKQIKVSKGESVVGCLIKQDAPEALAAYKAQLELMITGLAVGINYHQLAAMMKVKTAKNKELLALA